MDDFRVGAAGQLCRQLRQNNRFRERFRADYDAWRRVLGLKWFLADDQQEEKETRRQGDRETSRGGFAAPCLLVSMSPCLVIQQEDKETRRQGDKEMYRGGFAAPCLRVSVSPCLVIHEPPSIVAGSVRCAWTKRVTNGSAGAWVR